MRRRAAGKTQEQTQKTRLIRVRTADVYGGMVPARAQQDALLVCLAASIARRGMLQPIVVRKNAHAGRYALVCGARRLEACRMLNHQEIDALLIEADARESAACFMEEEMSRKPLGVMDEAEIIGGAALQHAGLSFGEEEAGRRAALLALPERVQDVVRRYDLTAGQALPLLDVPDAARQMEAALIIAERALTPAQAGRLVHGPQQDAKTEGVRRRALRTAMEEASASVRRMRLRGVDASLAVHSQERGICIQIYIQENASVRQEMEEKTRNT